MHFVKAFHKDGSHNLGAVQVDSEGAIWDCNYQEHKIDDIYPCVHIHMCKRSLFRSYLAKERDEDYEWETENREEADDLWTEPDSGEEDSDERQERIERTQIPYDSNGRPLCLSLPLH